MSDGRYEKYAQQIKKILNNEVGRKVVGDALGLTLTAHPEVSGKPIVALAMPSYNHPEGATFRAVSKMIAYSRQFFDVYDVPVIGSSVVHWARNQLIASALKGGKPFTHMLQIDDDIVPGEDYLVRMVNSEKDIVAAVCTRRQDPPLPNIRAYIPEHENFCQMYHWEDGLVEVGAAGTGMMLISRKTIDEVARYWIDCRFELEQLGADPAKMEEVKKVREEFYKREKDAFWFQFKDHPRGRGEYGEDIAFCWKAKQCGIKTYCDTTLQPGHIGKYEFGIKDYLPFKTEEMLKAEREGKITIERKPAEPEIVVVD